MTQSRQAPTADELLANATVIKAMEEAWLDSLPDDPMQRHEEGGWIYANILTGELSTRRAPRGMLARLDVSGPPAVSDAVVVGTFHTHPNPSSEGWDPMPSPGDQSCAASSGVPWLVRADDGFHSTGPVSRRGGLQGNVGYPA